MPDSAFASRLSGAMVLVGYNQTRLANELGVSTPTVSRWLAGTVPYRLTGMKLARVLGVSHEWLILGTPILEDREFTADMRRRLIAARQLAGLSLAEMAKRLGCEAPIYEGFEDGKATPRSVTLDLILDALNVNRQWLVEGAGAVFREASMYAQVSPREAGERRRRAAVMREDAASLLHEAERLEKSIFVPGEILDPPPMKYVPLSCVAQAPDDGEKKNLTQSYASRINAVMQSPKSALLRRLGRATRLRGKQSELAKALKVPQSRVSEWLHGMGFPTGESVLRLLEWVTAEEAKQKSLDDAEHTAKGKARIRKSTEYEKHRASRGKG